MNVVMNHAPGARSIARPFIQQSSVLPLYSPSPFLYIVTSLINFPIITAKQPLPNALAPGRQHLGSTATPGGWRACGQTTHPAGPRSKR